MHTYKLLTVVSTFLTVTMGQKDMLKHLGPCQEHGNCTLNVTVTSILINSGRVIITESDLALFPGSLGTIPTWVVFTALPLQGEEGPKSPANAALLICRAF